MTELDTDIVGDGERADQIEFWSADDEPAEVEFWSCAMSIICWLEYPDRWVVVEAAGRGGRLLKLTEVVAEVNNGAGGRDWRGAGLYWMREGHLVGLAHY